MAKKSSSATSKNPLASDSGEPQRSKPTANVASDSLGGSRWTFLTNHAHVLILLHAKGDLVLRDVASQVGITERAVQKIIQDLVEGGFIEIQRVGRRNHYQVFIDKPLRHPIEAHRQIGDLLKMIAPAKERGIPS